jgi:hypothetical protein
MFVKGGYGFCIFFIDEGMSDTNYIKILVRTTALIAIVGLESNTILILII